MPQDEVEIFLESSEPDRDYPFEVTLTITAFLQDSEYSDQNTLTLQCDPVGSNYTGSYLKVTLEDWSQLVEIRDFLAECFAESDINRQTLTIEVEQGIVSLTPYQEPPNEKEVEEITIEVHDNKVEFFRSGRLHPYIYTYEEKVDGDPQDENNAEKLLKYFNKIISLHPNSEPATREKEPIGLDALADHQHMKQLLSNREIVPKTASEQYRKAVAELNNEAYEDAIRDLGIGAESLVSLLSEDLYTESDIPNHMGGKLARITNMQGGQPAFIAKTITPLWWLRNQVSHPNDYYPTEKEALFALQCFELAAEKLIIDYFES